MPYDKMISQEVPVGFNTFHI